MAALDAAQRADQLKDDANRCSTRTGPRGLVAVHEAIGIQPSAVLYANRAAAQMRIGLQKAIEDAMKLSPDKTHAYYRKARVSETQMTRPTAASTTRFRTCHRMTITDEEGVALKTAISRSRSRLS